MLASKAPLLVSKLQFDVFCEVSISHATHKQCHNWLSAAQHFVSFAPMQFNILVSMSETNQENLCKRGIQNVRNTVENLNKRHQENQPCHCLTATLATQPTHHCCCWLNWVINLFQHSSATEINGWTSCRTGAAGAAGGLAQPPGPPHLLLSASAFFLTSWTFEKDTVCILDWGVSNAAACARFLTNQNWGLSQTKHFDWMQNHFCLRSGQWSWRMKRQHHLMAGDLPSKQQITFQWQKPAGATHQDWSSQGNVFDDGTKNMCLFSTSPSCRPTRHVGRVVHIIVVMR